MEGIITDTGELYEFDKMNHNYYAEMILIKDYGYTKSRLIKAVRTSVDVHTILEYARKYHNFIGVHHGYIFFDYILTDAQLSSIKQQYAIGKIGKELFDDCIMINNAHVGRGLTGA